MPASDRGQAPGEAEAALHHVAQHQRRADRRARRRARAGRARPARGTARAARRPCRHAGSSSWRAGSTPGSRRGRQADAQRDAAVHQRSGRRRSRSGCRPDRGNRPSGSGPARPRASIGPRSIATPQACRCSTTSSGPTAVMKQRSAWPGSVHGAGGPGVAGRGRAGATLIFWPPNFSAVRLSLAELLALHAEHALIPGGGDLDVLQLRTMWSRRSTVKRITPSRRRSRCPCRRSR